MVDLGHDLLLVLLETDHISYDDYILAVPDYAIPPEYKTVELFLKNKGKASKRICKEAEWKNQAELKEIEANWKHISNSTSQKDR
jgi:hypothetical protein